jgi:hypothetical protein
MDAKFTFINDTKFRDSCESVPFPLRRRPSLDVDGETAPKLKQIMGVVDEEGHGGKEGFRSVE